MSIIETSELFKCSRYKYYTCTIMLHKPFYCSHFMHGILQIIVGKIVVATDFVFLN